MIDSFRTFARSLTSPPEHARAVVPSDTTPLSYISRALFVGTAGAVVVEMLGGGIVTLANVPTGSAQRSASP